jgi:hypothetical protein
MLPRFPSPLAGEGGEGRSPEPDEGVLFGMNMPMPRTIASLAALLAGTTAAVAEIKKWEAPIKGSGVQLE